MNEIERPKQMIDASGIGLLPGIAPTAARSTDMAAREITETSELGPDPEPYGRRFELLLDRERRSRPTRQRPPANAGDHRPHGSRVLARS
jgi:hypothetical protein